MAITLTTKDNENHYIFEERDFVNLVFTYMGDEVGCYYSDSINTYIQQRDEAQDKEQTDLSNMEQQVESNELVFEQIREILDWLLSDILTPKINKSIINNQLKLIRKLIEN